MIVVFVVCSAHSLFLSAPLLTASLLQLNTAETHRLVMPSGTRHRLRLHSAHSVGKYCTVFLRRFSHFPNWLEKQQHWTNALPLD